MNLNRRALADYDHALRIRPNIAVAYYNKGVIYTKLSQPRRAITEYDRAISLNPEYVKAYVNRGIMYQRLGQPRRAIENYNRALLLDPRDLFAWNNRGMANEVLGNRKAAIRDYLTALLINPDYKVARRNLRRLGVVVGQRDLAAKAKQWGVQLPGWMSGVALARLVEGRTLMVTVRRNISIPNLDNSFAVSFERRIGGAQFGRALLAFARGRSVRFSEGRWQRTGAGICAETRDKRVYCMTFRHAKHPYTTYHLGALSHAYGRGRPGASIQAVPLAFDLRAARMAKGEQRIGPIRIDLPREHKWRLADFVVHGVFGQVRVAFASGAARKERAVIKVFFSELASQSEEHRKRIWKKERSAVIAEIAGSKDIRLISRQEFQIGAGDCLRVTSLYRPSGRAGRHDAGQYCTIPLSGKMMALVIVAWEEPKRASSHDFRRRVEQFLSGGVKFDVGRRRPRAKPRQRRPAGALEQKGAPGKQPLCRDVGGYEAYMKRTGKVCWLD